jgi:hypothetical protein
MNERSFSFIGTHIALAKFMPMIFLMQGLCHNIEKSTIE